MRILFLKIPCFRIPSSFQDTALHLAAEYNEAQSIESLLKHGADKELKNNVGLSPVQVAAIKLNFESLEVLLKYGADYTVIT